MADFLYVLRGGSTKLSKDETAAHMQEWGAYMKTLSDAGQYKGGSPLKEAGKQVTPTEVIAKPAGRGKTVVTGYMLVTAKTIAQATKLAKACPILKVGGSVEVRPIRPM